MNYLHNESDTVRVFTLTNLYSIFKSNEMLCLTSIGYTINFRPGKVYCTRTNYLFNYINDCD